MDAARPTAEGGNWQQAKHLFHHRLRHRCGWFKEPNWLLRAFNLWKCLKKKVNKGLHIKASGFPVGENISRPAHGAKAQGNLLRGKLEAEGLCSEAKQPHLEQAGLQQLWSSFYSFSELNGAARRREAQCSLSSPVSPPVCALVPWSKKACRVHCCLF